ncbi:MAG: anhydro-N-acetylmuramic acid kinase [Gammaproteobacteria bacterium]|nr:anhydro-N-acetylmuramic acid kinase [Gammaproteobacteria bacterium]
MPELYLGLISGTSLDGIDTALVEFNPTPRVVFAHSYPLRPELRAQVLEVINNAGTADVASIGRLDHAFGIAFAWAAEQAMRDAGVSASDVAAIGSHGQTLWHDPEGEHPFTWQITDANLIAARTGRPVVADFRRKDMAMCGQGAPLACGYHREIFASLSPVAVINLGGIANVTLIRGDEVTGFDTGPANALTDAWIYAHGDGSAYDKDGAWAASGVVNEDLLERMLAEPYFKAATPKSTGKELFNLAWVEQHLDGDEAPENVQATLCELSARTVAAEVNRAGVEHAIVVGGGAHNPELLRRLETNLESARLETSAAHGHDPDFIEAACFAWLAHQRMKALPGNVATVTGASAETILGGLYLP